MRSHNQKNQAKNAQGKSNKKIIGILLALLLLLGAGGTAYYLDSIGYFEKDAVVEVPEPPVVEEEEEE